MKSYFGKAFKFYPKTFVLPNDWERLSEHAAKGKGYQICKPTKGSKGEGIKIVKAGVDIHNTVNIDKCIVQKQVNKPMLVEGLKFDIRLQVLVKIDPLELWISNEGLARFSTMAQSEPTLRNQHKANMHLTNYAQNKDCSDYVASTGIFEDKGSKRCLSVIIDKLNWIRSAPAILDCLIKTFLSLHPFLMRS